MKNQLFFTLISLILVTFTSCKKEAGNDPNGSWEIELMAQYNEVFSGDSYDLKNNIFSIELAGTGTFSIDWGDGTVLADVTLKPSVCDEYGWYSGSEYTHTYDKVGTYQIKVSGTEGALLLFTCSNDRVENFYSSLQLKNCSQLKWLACFGNNLTSLSLNNCAQLSVLYCESNQLSTLDISKNSQLQILDCSSNQLSALDVSKNLQLQELDCWGNQLSTLDVGKNLQLYVLNCGNNQLKVLDISKNMQLKKLGCADNYFSISALNKIYTDLPTCSDNDPGYLDVDNKESAGDYYIAEEKGWIVL
ncbi:leucine-rich repeat domain-containing protein [Millionella massiliensis]|uniref:leucine-rich repeat domain-containing protein n=1 Tax=Millionella massiliensis TaxID=1871023 RepID=UPI0023A7F29B|nr:hypothetical protein [Millionella massiliensis]